LHNAKSKKTIINIFINEGYIQMINVDLTDFIDTMIQNKRITERDALNMHKNILTEGLICRDEADLLIALDRAISDKDAAFSDILAGYIVDYVVWGERPTGRIDTDKAKWLAASLSAGHSLGSTAIRIARDAIKEAQETDEHLLTFVMKAQACEARGTGFWGEAPRL
jgi:hypothetical protein